MHAKVVKIWAKIKDQPKSKQLNKQSLVRPDKVVPSGVTILSRGARRRLAMAEAHIVPPDEVLCVENGF
jgi:ABC-type lipoprotein export system ATPase subunit